MRIFITGATGLIGTRLVRDRLARGDDLVLLSRDAQRARTLFADLPGQRLHIVEGDPAQEGKWQQSLASCDAVIHLAGAAIADRRWTRSYKQVMRRSRIDSTRLIVNAMANVAAPQRPRILINGSAIGYYGDAGDRELHEAAPPGQDFLAQLTVAWEHEALRAAALPDGAVRVVLLRTAVVLDDQGGALRKMLTPFRFFIGGPLGSGQQWMSWIHWRDLVGIIDLALHHPQAHGPINASSPQPLRNRDFARILGKVLRRPAIVPTPPFALRMALGEVAHALLSSQRVIPARALELGYQFQFADLQSALVSLLRERQGVFDQPDV